MKGLVMAVVIAVAVVGIWGGTTAHADQRLCARDSDCGAGGFCPEGVCLYGQDAEAARRRLPPSVPPPPVDFATEVARAASAAQALAIAKKRAPVLRADGGLGSTVGLLGLSAEVPVLPWLGVEGGWGFGISGYQYSLVLRQLYFLRDGSDVVGLAVGGSLADPTATDRSNGARTNYWANGEVAYEHRFDGHLLLSWAIGATYQLPGSGPWYRGCLTGCGTAEELSHRLYPTLRSGIGVWF
jgi:hypothetical protein